MDLMLESLYLRFTIGNKISVMGIEYLGLNMLCDSFAVFEVFDSAVFCFNGCLY